MSRAATGLEVAEGPRLLLPMQPLARVAVVLTLLTSGIVFSEPAPVDALFAGLVVLLPLAGLVAFTPSLVLYLALWIAAGAGALMASAMSTELPRSLTHTGVSFFLYIVSFVLAGFIATRPKAHAELILKAWVPAALVAALAGIAGYFSAFPGAFDLFTKFGRATGTFKDPNVFGPFLIPAILYCGHRLLERFDRHAWPYAAAAPVLVLAVLLSFSRGAWISLGVAVAVYALASWATAPTAEARARLALAGAAVLTAAALVMVLAVQSEAVSKLLAERSSLNQGYDVGPEGRFGGHEKAKALILDNPLGIGATQFSTLHHHEDVHNVYLSMFLNAGWLGGTLYAVGVGVTMLLGLWHLTRWNASRPLFVLVYAAFAGNVLEGIVIDTDHWRHFYILMAMVWGLVAAEDRARAAQAAMEPRNDGNAPARDALRSERPSAAPAAKAVAFERGPRRRRQRTLAPRGASHFTRH